MKTKHFLIALVLSLVIGGIGGGVVGFVVADDTDKGTATAGEVAPNGGGLQSGQQFDVQAVRDRIRSGDISPEDIARFRERMSGNTGASSTRNRNATRPGEDSGGEIDTANKGNAKDERDTEKLETSSEKDGGEAGVEARLPDTGVIENLSGSTVTLTTTEGSLEFVIGSGTLIRHFVSGELADLEVDQRVTIIGRPGEAGLSARLVIVTPEGISPFQGFGGGRGQRSGMSGGGFGNFGGIITGTIIVVEGDKISLQEQGNDLVTRVESGEAVIQVVSALSQDELKIGQRVTVTREKDGDARVVSSILVLPDIRSLFGFGRAP